MEERPFAKILLGEDELGVVLRAHSFLEHDLDRLIGSVLPQPDALGRLGYSAKVRLAIACGLRRELKSPLDAFGSLRNRFAHERDKRLTPTDIDGMRAAFKRIGEEVIDFVLDLAEQRPQNCQRFQLIRFIVALRGLIHVETHRLNACRSTQGPSTPRELVTGRPGPPTVS